MDLWREDEYGDQVLSWRRFGVLVQQLPPESATATALRLEDSQLPPGARPQLPPPNPEAEQWSRLEHLVASVRDELLTLRWLYGSVHSDKKLPWKPEPLARPGIAAAKKAALPSAVPEDVSALAAYLSRTQGGDVTYN